jgi:hypothetical protein
LNLKCEKVVSKCGFKFNLYRYTSACRAGYRRALFWWDPDQCFACPAGRFNQDDAVDQDGCAACDPGSFAPHAASTRCHLCPSSQFADKAGMDTCDVCTDLSGGDMITVSSGSSSRRQCLCPKGTWVNSGDIAAAVSPNASDATSSTSSIWVTSRPDYVTTAAMIAAGTSGVDEEAKVFDDDLGAQSELAVVLPIVFFNGTIERAALADGMRCAMHDPVKCAVAMAAAVTATSKDVSGLLGNGVCNPSANVRECGWDCGDCCRGSCLTRASRTVAGLDATNACPPVGLALFTTLIWHFSNLG